MEDLTPLDGGDGGAPGGVQVPLDQATHPLHSLVVIQQPVIRGNLAEKVLLENKTKCILGSDCPMM